MKMIQVVYFSLVLIFISFTDGFSQASLKKYGIEIQKIIKKDEVGIVRGYDFNTTSATIKSTEDAKLELETPTAMIYKVAINDKEFCEVIYNFDASKKLKSVGLEFFETPGAKPEEQIVDDFQNYFNARFGPFKVNEKDDEVWTSKDGTYSIEMSDESTGDMIEIEIEISKK